MKLTKTHISFLLLLLTFQAFAQKVKIKKDKVLFDKVEVANCEDSDSGFVFSSLNNENTITAKFKMLKITEEITKKWVIVSDKDKERTSEVEMEYFSVTMSNKKAVAELLAKKYNLITTNGVENIDAFFEVERPNLTQEYNELIKGEVAIQKEIKGLNINVDYDLNRIFEGTIPYTSSSVDNREREKGIYPNMLGTYGVKVNPGINSNVYTIYDLDGNITAVATLGSFKKIEVTIPFRKEKFEYTTKESLGQNKSNYEVGEFIKEIVGQLYLNKVYLGHQINQEKQKNKIVEETIRKEQFEKAQAESINVFEQDGFVIDKEGNKTEGKITAYFESIAGSNIDDTQLKKLVKLQTTNSSGKTVYRSYKSSSEAKFCVAETNKCYRGIKSFVAYIYVEILNESSEISTYKSIDTNNFYISTPGNKKPLAIYNNKPKTIEKVKEYLKCEAINDEMSRFDFEDSKSVLDLTNTYKNSCK